MLASWFQLAGDNLHFCFILYPGLRQGPIILPNLTQNLLASEKERDQELEECAHMRREHTLSEKVLVDHVVMRQRMH